MIKNNHAHPLSIGVELHFSEHFELQIFFKLPYYVNSNVSVKTDYLVVGFGKFEAVLLGEFDQGYFVRGLTLESYFVINLFGNTVVANRQNFEKFLD